MDPGTLHHLELWVDDLDGTEQSFGWLLTRLGFRACGRSGPSISLKGSGPYLPFEGAPDHRLGHDRLRSGLNHLALNAGSGADADAIVDDAPQHGWTLLCADRYPSVGGADHYAACLENGGFEVELVAGP